MFCSEKKKIIPVRNEPFLIEEIYYVSEIYFTKSSRGRPAIIIDGIKYLFMSENHKRVVWRCSSMATSKLKCPARILQYKNPERFVIHRERHIHAPLKRHKVAFIAQEMFTVMD